MQKTLYKECHWVTSAGVRGGASLPICTGPSYLVFHSLCYMWFKEQRASGPKVMLTTLYLTYLPVKPRPNTDKYAPTVIIDSSNMALGLRAKPEYLERILEWETDTNSRIWTENILDVPLHHCEYDNVYSHLWPSFLIGCPEFDSRVSCYFNILSVQSILFNTE